MKKLIEEKSRSILPSSMIPKVVVLESDYPRLVNGKVDRQTLVRTLESKLDEVKAFICPLNWIADNTVSSIDCDPSNQVTFLGVYLHIWATLEVCNIFWGGSFIRKFAHAQN